MRIGEGFTKIHFEFAHFSFFHTHLELKLLIRSFTPVATSYPGVSPTLSRSVGRVGENPGNEVAPIVPSKTIPDSRSKWAKSIPVFRPKRRKNHTLLYGGTNLYGMYKEVPPGCHLVFLANPALRLAVKSRITSRNFASVPNP